MNKIEYAIRRDQLVKRFSNLGYEVIAMYDSSNTLSKRNASNLVGHAMLLAAGATLGFDRHIPPEKAARAAEAFMKELGIPMEGLFK